MNAIAYPFEVAPAEGEATEIADGILWLRLPLPMALDHVNVYALDDGDGWTIIDTGLNSRRGQAIWEAIQAGPLAGRPIRRLIVTHHHPDHVGLAGWFQSQGVELLMTRTAWLYARMLTLDEQPLPTPEALAFYRRAGVPDDILEKRAAERPFNFCDVVHPMPAGFTALTEGNVIQMAGRDWVVRLGSGHAPDHATFWSGDLVIGGDQLLPGISANIGVYPTEPAADPLADWFAACRRFLPLATDRQLILPGHKLPFTGLPIRLGQMIENHDAALSRLLLHLQSPQTAHACLTPLFKREIQPSEHGLALVEAIAHLNHLLNKGLVDRRMGDKEEWLWQTIR